MEGKVIQFRRGRKTQKPRHFLIEIPGVDNREKAKKFVSKKVEWTSPGKKILTGEIKSAHGNNGILRAIFDIGLPGQAIGTKCEVLTHANKDDKKDKENNENKNSKEYKNISQKREVKK